jgi:hypothetical protein
MRKLKLLFVTAIIALVGGCSGDNTLVADPSAPDNTLPGAEIATLTLLTSAVAIDSDGSQIATITALVRDANNNVMDSIPISFSADSGSLSVTQPATSDETGKLTAALSPGGDLANRTITVTAAVTSTTGTITTTITVAVTGTQVELSGVSSLPVGQSSNYFVVLTDSSGSPISGASVTVTSALGNTINVSPVTTDLTGQGSFTLSADNAGIDSLSASALGATAAPFSVTMSADAFSFSAPAPDPIPEIPLNTNQSVTVNWQSGGVPVTGLPVNFSTTRGAVAPTVANSVAGNATVNISATNAGLAVITATNTDGTTTQLEVEFVATVPATLEVQASPLNLGVNEQSTVTATVRDAAGNFVKNQIIDFSLTDITGGTLSVGQANTNSAGQAQTFYTASTVTSAVDGVIVAATVQTAPAVTDLVNLTVAERAQFLSIGTGNEISEINNDSQYQVVYAIQVTDALGVGVAGETVQVSVLSNFYMKGFRALLAPPLNGWTTSVIATCQDEDVNRNGILDAGEDFNSSGQLEANNIATVSATNGGTLVTDSNGFVLVNVTYPQEYAYYVQVTLRATLQVGGTEFAESAAFTLSGAASDFSNSANSPPGPVSPFGSLNATCADTI